MTVHVAALASYERGERYVGGLGEPDGETSRPRDGREQFDAAHRGFLDHLIAGTARHDDKAAARCPAGARQRAEHFVERVVASNVFTHHMHLAVGWRPTGAVHGARFIVDRLAAR